MTPPRFSVENPIAANLLMWFLILGGAWFAVKLPREIFRTIEPNIVLIRVMYPGSTPEDVEKGMVMKIEEAVHDLTGVEEISSSVVEGGATVMVEFADGTDLDVAVNDVKAELDRLQNLPDEAEKLAVERAEISIPVISVVVYGEAGERTLRAVGDKVRDELLALDDVTQAEVSGVRDREVSVEVDPAKLEKYNLTFQQVAMQIGSHNIDVPGGKLKAVDGEIRLRTLGEDEDVLALEEIIIKADEAGRVVRLRDVATVNDGFKDTIKIGRHNGKPAAKIDITKTSAQDSIRIARAVKDYVAEKQGTFEGSSLSIDYRDDMDRVINEYLKILVKNAFWGLVLIFISLSFFLHPRIAFWTAVGVPVSVLGTFIVMKMLGYSVNVVTLFGLILILGMVVDDAIILGENIFQRYYLGMSAHEAAIKGAEEVMWPVFATILTTVAAFLPIAFADGQMGKMFIPIAGTVIAALTISLVEAFIVLPSHLSHALKKTKRDHVTVDLEEERIIFEDIPNATFFQRVWIAKERLINERLTNVYVSILDFTIRWRYVAATLIMVMFFLTIVMVKFDRPPTQLMPDIDSDIIVADLEMVAGTPVDQTIQATQEIENAALALPELKSLFSSVGSHAILGSPLDAMGVMEADPATLAQLNIELDSAEVRERSSHEIVAQLRSSVKFIEGVQSIKFTSISGAPTGADFVIEVHGDDIDILVRAVQYIKEEMSTITGIADISSNMSAGKLEARLELKPQGRIMGLTVRDLAMQMRSAIFGAEAQTLQRGKDEIEVQVRLAREARDSIGDLERMRIATPAGGRVPLGEVGRITMGRGYTSLARVDQRRAVTVKADLDKSLTDTPAHIIISDLEETFEQIGKEYPGVRLKWRGEKEEIEKSNASTSRGMLFSLLFIYGILSLVFRSYIQPTIIMFAIPFGLIGAVFGHLVMDKPLSNASWMGMVALTGIVVNDSLILIDFINRHRARGVPPHKAILDAGRKRLRAILLTSVTTIIGLLPLLSEQSFQAQQVVPMAISLAYGLMFSTVLILLIIPCFYFILHDIQMVVHYLWTGRWEDPGVADREPVKSFQETEIHSPDEIPPAH